MECDLVSMVITVKCYDQLLGALIAKNNLASAKALEAICDLNKESFKQNL